jgi:hypothetical protein
MWEIKERTFMHLFTTLGQNSKACILSVNEPF